MHANVAGLVAVTKSKMLAYVGLELAMLVIQFNEVEEYWNNEMLYVLPDFMHVMSWQDFTNIHVQVKFMPQNVYVDKSILS